MKALTLWQPWASLIAIGAKTVETRSWSTPYRGPLAIHAAARPVRPDEVTPEIAQAFYDAETDALSAPLRAIVAVCELVDCVSAPEALRGRQTDAPFGDFSDGRFGWILENVRPVEPSQIVKGGHRLWELADSIA